MSFSARRFHVISQSAIRAKLWEELGINPQVVAWDGRTLGAWASEIDGADVVVNLAGRSVNCRYTPKQHAPR